MIQKDEYRAGQGYRNIRGWSFRCLGCGFKSYVYRSQDVVRLIQEEHSRSCFVSGSDLTKVTVINQKAMSKVRLPV